MKALVLLGCPETPSQTPMAVYVFNRLTHLGYDVTIAANPAASKLVGFVHKDAAASFFVTFEQILQCKSLALVFSRDGDEVAEFVSMIEESGSNAVIAAVRAFHNPSPIKVKFERAIKEFE